jgi:hypothetical protein
MNKVIYAVAVFFISILLMNSTKANAQLFSPGEKTLAKISTDLKKINSRLVKIDTSDLTNLSHQLEDLLRQIEEVKQVLPQLQGSVEMNKSETLSGLNKTNSKLDDLKAEVKHALPQDSIGDVIDQINAQNKRLDDTNSIFRSELIPTIDKKIETNQDKVNLANEKLSRLIIILKEIVTDQVKIRESLADLRRKSNINISRNDDIKKMLRQLNNDN